jgi:dTDP-4-amino-4,6-dideoxygalactose transaminase
MSRLAILGGKALRTKAWPKWPVHGPEDERNLLAVLNSEKMHGWHCGEWNERFERAYADFQDARYGVACANGTVAIEAALLAAGIGFGDEVITTPYTFVATTSSILKVNALPIYADIHEATGNLDPDDVERRITPKTKAIVPVHVGGMPVDIDRFDEIGRKHKLTVIYDAAHGWGSQWRGKGVGAYGQFNTYSFQTSKNITCGEGGIILSCDQLLANTARSYVNCGRAIEGGWYEHFLVGANLRMSEFAAALLMAQLGRLEAQTAVRTRNAAVLRKLLERTEGIRLPPEDARVTRRAFHIFQMLYDKEAWKGMSRDRFIAALDAEGIPLIKGWSLMYRLGLFAQERPFKSCPALYLTPKGERPDYLNLRLPNAEKLSGETGLWLMQSHLLAEESDMKDVADGMAKVRDNLDELLAADLPKDQTSS